MTGKRIFFGKGIVDGMASGYALVSTEDIALSLVIPSTGVIAEYGHPLNGTTLAGRVIIFPTGRGSSSGSYQLYNMSRIGSAPAAIINVRGDAVTAAGAALAHIPLVHRLDANPITEIRTGDFVRVDGAVGKIEILRYGKLKSCA